MKDIRKRCNPTVNLLNFTSNKKILNKVVTYFVTKLCPIKNIMFLFFYIIKLYMVSIINYVNNQRFSLCILWRAESKRTNFKT